MKTNITFSGVVLIVDDNPETMSMLNATLSEVGLTVLVALSGEQALTIARRIKPDIILMDAMMPEMDGFEACRRIKADAVIAHIPVIFMTGLSASEDMVRGFDAGGIDYVTKPINVQGIDRENARSSDQLADSYRRSSRAGYPWPTLFICRLKRQYSLVNTQHSQPDGEPWRKP
jgi:CheY-like chemotaxis protein